MYPITFFLGAENHLRRMFCFNSVFKQLVLLSLIVTEMARVSIFPVQPTALPERPTPKCNLLCLWKIESFLSLKPKLHGKNILEVTSVY